MRRRLNSLRGVKVVEWKCRGTLRISMSRRRARAIKKNPRRRQGDKAANVSGAARDTMWTEGAQVIQTSGNGENETKADIRGRDAVVSWASCKAIIPGEWRWLNVPRFVTRICGERRSPFPSLFSKETGTTRVRHVSIFHMYSSSLPFFISLFLSSLGLRGARTRSRSA